MNNIDSCIIDCCLCQAIIDANTNGVNSKIENRLIYENEHFIVIPSLGPFTEGQIMIVSKVHYPSLNKMPISILLDLLSIFDIIKKKIKDLYGLDILLAEHGAISDIQKGGACVIHTHLHCIPGFNDGIQTFETQLEMIYRGYDLRVLWEVQKPYILIINSIDNMISVYNGEDVPSEMIRKSLLASKGITTNWSWRTKFNIELITKTLKDWSRIDKK